MFKGVGTALITPFNKENEIDFYSLKKIIDHQLKNKVDALIVLGTTGESPVISEEERRKLVSTVVEQALGKAKIIVGTGTNDTKKVVKLNKMSKDLGADGVLIVNPYYNKGSQESLVEHYKYISEKSDLPIILYNVPSRTAMNMLPETILKIHEQCKNVVAVKEASGNISQIANLIAMKPDTLSVLSGNDDQTLPIMALGGDGVVSVFSNAFPGQFKSLTEALLSGDISKAKDLNTKYNKMMNLLFVETSPSPIKYVMNKMGLCENILRLPLIALSRKNEKVLSDELETYN